MDSTNHSQYLAPACEIARDAGKLIMGYFSGGFTTSRKDDKSPVTEADIAANGLITRALAGLAPHIPVIAEEDETPGSNNHKLFFLVDPLDGTRSFVRGEDEFTVNIGLIENGKPVFGVIYAPVQKLLYFGGANGAFRQLDGSAAEKIHARKTPPEGLTIFRSRTEMGKVAQDYVAKLQVHETVSSSSSIKFCKIAEGVADIYPRFGRTMEWDTAAGHAILNAAGGRVETVDGVALGYGKSGFENPHFIAFGG